MGIPAAGQTAPDFEIKTDAGNTVRLSDYRGKKVVLYFYPKADTPGCTKQACLFRDNYGAFEKLGVTVLGASYDTVEEQAAFKQKYNLPFTLLADADHSLSEQYGVWGDHKFTNNEGNPVEFHGLRRSTFIIDENGEITWSKYGVDAANNTAEVLEQLK
jgi:thioredoxin-dependent peroxiredoxin